MQFWKMNGAGNDFIVVDDRANAIPDEKWPEIIRTLCERHMSIGADGFMVVKNPTYGGDYKMLFFNSDGSLGEMCGNGARCICRFGYENGLAGEVQKVETTAGLVTGWRIDRQHYRVRLNDPCHMRLEDKAEVDGVTYDCAYVELGDPGIPHAIVLMPDWDERDHDMLRALGRALRFAEEFPRGANVSFVKVVDVGHVKAITYERGVEDFTLACGTGCGSIAAALRLLGLGGDELAISMPGGELTVSLTASGGSVQDIYLTGPTNVVCTGDILDEDVLG